VLGSLAYSSSTEDSARWWWVTPLNHLTLWSLGWPWGSCQAPELQGAASLWGDGKEKYHDENPKKGIGEQQEWYDEALDSFHDPWGVHPWVHRVKENVPPSIYLTFCCVLFWMSTKHWREGRVLFWSQGLNECQVDNFVPSWYYPKYILQAGAALAHVCWLIN
jgi:hypothetical protein